MLSKAEAEETLTVSKHSPIHLLRTCVLGHSHCKNMPAPLFHLTGAHVHAQPFQHCSCSQHACVYACMHALRACACYLWAAVPCHSKLRLTLRSEVPKMKTAGLLSLKQAVRLSRSDGVLH